MDEKEPDAIGPPKAPRIERTLHSGQYASRALGRMQPFAYYLPEDSAGTEEPRYPMLALLHGLNGSYRDWPTHTRLAAYAAAMPLVIVFPDGGNGWYTNAAEGSARYEDDFVQDFLPHIQATLPVREPGRAWGIGGLSMGGYGAVKLALKYPQLFSVAVSHSGSFEKMRIPESHPVFGDPQKDARLRHAEDPFYLAELAMCRWPTERPFLHLDCGLFDPLLEGNRRFAAHLNFLGYRHSYREMRGYHTWPYWNRAIRTILPAIARALGA
ncbi:MAG TPA: alpha/beta hydrolase family protein [Chthonomonadaceae bacterium]|nr:alpha/beta hydrolase family protein [Chthonomonadaceae bacterium]